MLFQFDLKSFAVLAVLVITTAFGLIVYNRDRKDATNKSFFLFTLSVIAWCLSMILYRGFSDEMIVTVFARILYLSAVLIPFALLRFGIFFPDAEYKLTRWQKYILPLPVLLIALLAVLPTGLIHGVSIIPDAENIIHFDFALQLAYVFYINTYFLLFFWILGKKFSYAYSGGILHQQLFYILFGTFLSATIGVVANLMLPLLGIFAYNWFGQVGLIFMVTFITFAILKYRLFNARVISAVLLMAVLWVCLIVNMFFSVSTTQQIINIAVFFATIVAGILLIASVKREVSLREQLEQANAGQKNLIHIMNHQIKGYLGMAKNIFAELLDGDYGTMPKGTLPLLDKGLETTDSGVKYVTTILRGASAEAGSLVFDMQPIDIRDVVEKCVEKERPFVEERQLGFSVNIAVGDYRTLGDFSQLCEVARNLIENAVYYTPTGSITVSLSELYGDILFSVKDTGVGIKPEDKNKLFKQGGVTKDSIKINVNSSGYGLVFVKGVVEAHEGKVWFESAGEGKGSEFFVLLPKKIV